MQLALALQCVFLQCQAYSFRHPNWTATPHTDYSVYLILTRQFKCFSYLEIRNMWLNVFEDCYQSTPKCLLNELNVASSAQRASRAKHQTSHVKVFNCISQSSDRAYGKDDFLGIRDIAKLVQKTTSCR